MLFDRGLRLFSMYYIGHILTSSSSGGIQCILAHNTYFAHTEIKYELTECLQQTGGI